MDEFPDPRNEFRLEPVDPQAIGFGLFFESLEAVEPFYEPLSLGVVLQWVEVLGFA